MAAARSREPVLAKMRLMCVLTVWLLRKSCAAISELLRPRAMRARISASRWVSPSGGEAALPGPAPPPRPAPLPAPDVRQRHHDALAVGHRLAQVLTSGLEPPVQAHASFGLVRQTGAVCPIARVVVEAPLAQAADERRIGLDSGRALAGQDTPHLALVHGEGRTTPQRHDTGHASSDAVRHRLGHVTHRRAEAGVGEIVRLVPPFGGTGRGHCPLTECSRHTEEVWQRRVRGGRAKAGLVG